MTISTIMTDAKRWPDRFDDIVDGYLHHRRQLQQLDLSPEEFATARRLLEIVLTKARRRGEAA